jgi:hypothetical protein
MKRNVTLAGACLAAVSALALAATPAQAAHGLPEFGRCIKRPFHGEYNSSRCTGEFDGTYTGSFAWVSPVGIEHAAAYEGSSTTAVLETVGGAKVSCGAGRFSGEAIAVHSEAGKSVSVNIRLSECRNAAGQACQSSPVLTGVIGTAVPLEGVTEFTRSGERLRAGLVLYEKEGPELHPVLLAFECGTVPEPIEEWVVEGSVIATITPLNVMGSTFKLTFRATEGKQVPEELEYPGQRHALDARISGDGPEQAGLTIRGERRAFPITFDEAVEIKAR